MPDDNGKSHLSLLEIFKALSNFISTVVLAAVVAVLTNQYNTRQLEIARIKEISTLIPELGNNDPNKRKFSAIALGLYGENAIPALMALLNDPDGQVRLSSVKSLEIIGNEAVTRLEKVVTDKRNPVNSRASSLYALGAMKAEAAYKLARNALEDKTENPIVRKDAANALGMLKDTNSVKMLLEILDKSKTNDVELSQAIVVALGQIAHPDASRSLISLLSHENEDLRYATVDALALIQDKSVTPILSGVAANDVSPKVKEAAQRAIKWVTRKADSPIGNRP